MAERAASEPAEGEAMTKIRWQEARKARFLELQAGFLHLPPLSAAEREVERESERKGDSEACTVLDAREEAND
jgi:hypothetical protein